MGTNFTDYQVRRIHGEMLKEATLPKDAKEIKPSERFKPANGTSGKSTYKTDVGGTSYRIEIEHIIPKTFSANSGFVRLFQESGAGTRSAAPQVTLNPLDVKGIYQADINNDGDQDLIILGAQEMIEVVNRDKHPENLDPGTKSDRLDLWWKKKGLSGAGYVRGGKTDGMDAKTLESLFGKGHDAPLDLALAVAKHKDVNARTKYLAASNVQNYNPDLSDSVFYDLAWDDKNPENLRIDSAMSIFDPEMQMSVLIQIGRDPNVSGEKRLDMAMLLDDPSRINSSKAKTGLSRYYSHYRKQPLPNPSVSASKRLLVALSRGDGKGITEKVRVRSALQLHPNSKEDLDVLKGCVKDSSLSVEARRKIIEHIYDSFPDEGIRQHLVLAKDESVNTKDQVRALADASFELSQMRSSRGLSRKSRSVALLRREIRKAAKEQLRGMGRTDTYYRDVKELTR